MNQPLTGNLLVASSLVSDPVYAGGVCLIVHHDESNVIGVMLNRPIKPSAQALLEVMGNADSSTAGGHNRLADYDPSLSKEDLFDQASHDQSVDEDQSRDEDVLFDEAVSNEAVNNDHDQLDLEFDEEPFDQESVEQNSAAWDLSDRTPIDPPSDESELPSVPAGQNSPFSMLHFGGPRSGPVVAIHQTSEFAEAETGKGIYVAAQRQHLEELVRDHPAPYRLIVGHLGWEVDELAAEMDAGLWHIVPATTEAVFSPAMEMWPQLIRRATSNSLAKWIGIPDVVAAGDLN